MVINFAYVIVSHFQVRVESEENVQREAEAVEQVKRSVQVAEQARMEKHELEFEIEQLKMQVSPVERVASMEKFSEWAPFSTVFPKVRSADHFWSAIISNLVRETKK